MATMYDDAGERSDACFDWSRGSCARGESCRFSHEGTPGANPNAGAHVRGPTGAGSGSASPHRMAAGVCFDYAKGTCKRGDQCRFSHDAVAVAAFAKIASIGGGVGSGNGSTAVSGSGSPTSGSGRLAASSIPKPLPISGALAAAAAKASSGGVSSGGAVPKVEPAPIARRTGAVDYASAAKAGVATATEGSFAAALVGKRLSENAGAASATAAQPPVPTSPAPAESKVTPALTASGASVPAPRFPPAPNVMAAQPPMPATDAAAAALAKPTYQFGTGSMLAPQGGEQPRVDAVSSSAAAVPKPNTNSSGGISFGNGAPAVPKAYPKPEFAFGSGAAATPPVAAPAGFVPPVPSGPPPVPAGPPPEANQRAHVAVPPAGFGFSQHGLGVATTPEKAAPQQSGSVWGAGAPATTNDAAAVVNGLGAEWDVSGMGMEGLAVDYSGTGTYDALGGASPFGVGLGYSLFSPSAAVQQTDAGAAQRAQPQSMWGSNFGGYGGF